MNKLNIEKKGVKKSNIIIDVGDFKGSSDLKEKVKNNKDVITLNLYDDKKNIFGDFLLKFIGYTEGGYTIKRKIKGWFSYEEESHGWNKLVEMYGYIPHECIQLVHPDDMIYVDNKWVKEPTRDDVEKKYKPTNLEKFPCLYSIDFDLTMKRIYTGEYNSDGKFVRGFLLVCKSEGKKAYVEDYHKLLVSYVYNKIKENKNVKNVSYKCGEIEVSTTITNVEECKI